MISHVLRHKQSAHRCLCMPRTATKSEMRKHYLKLARRLHPDKAKHAQAQEAFHVMCAAFNRVLRMRGALTDK